MKANTIPGIQFKDWFYLLCWEQWLYCWWTKLECYNDGYNACCHYIPNWGKNLTKKYLTASTYSYLLDTFRFIILQWFQFINNFITVKTDGKIFLYWISWKIPHSKERVSIQILTSLSIELFVISFSMFVGAALWTSFFTFSKILNFSI